jgi:hypothetical protein
VDGQAETGVAASPPCLLIERKGKKKKIRKSAEPFCYNQTKMQDPDFDFKDLLPQQHFDSDCDMFCAIVDACIRAMEEGTLSVTAQGSKGRYYLWETYILTVDQWARICALLQRHRLPPGLLWRDSVYNAAYFTMAKLDMCCHFVNEIPTTIDTLCRIDYLWRDLDAVDAWIKREQTSQVTTDVSRMYWVQAEVVHRRQWLAELRVAWLRAVVR